MPTASSRRGVSRQPRDKGPVSNDTYADKCLARVALAKEGIIVRG
jgi:hypothetical protein